MRRWRGNACAVASLTGCRRRERCAPIAGECPCSRVVGGTSPVRVLCDDSSGLRANPCSARIISRMTSRRSSSCGSSSPSVADDAAARRGASVPRREPASSSAWGRPLLRDHELAALGCFRLAARKLRLFETCSPARGVRLPYAGLGPYRRRIGEQIRKVFWLGSARPHPSALAGALRLPPRLPSALARALGLPRLPRTRGRSNRLRARSRPRCSWA